MFALSRLGYPKGSQDLIIPYEEGKKIAVLQELQELLKKFGFVEKANESTKESLDNFYREQRAFKEFSEKARTIRNNEFSNMPELEAQFSEFHGIVSQKFTRTLKDFQWLSSFHMAFAQNACNFSVPGAGKTTIVYAAYTYLKNTRDSDKKIDKLVVVVPKASFFPWENEYQACFGLEVDSERIASETDTSQKKQHLASGNPAELTLISYHSVPNLQEQIGDFINNNNVMLVVDEAHRIKSVKGKNASSILEVCKEAKSRIVLTGTPLPNGYEDLFNLYKFIYPYHYKDILQFHYGNLRDMTKNHEFESARVSKLISNISPFFIRVKKNDLNLPEVSEQIISVEMDSHQRKIYDFIEEQYIEYFRKDSSSTVKDILNKARLIRLRQASTNPSLLVRPIIETLDSEDESIGLLRDTDEGIADEEIFQEILNYKDIVPEKFIAIHQLLNKKVMQSEKLIIWTIFVKNAEQLQEYLQSKDINSELLLGKVEQAERDRIVKQFNDPGNMDFQVVIANPFTVSESISLHKGCHNAIYMERDYNCANFLQSKDRIHRVGLEPDQVTNYYYFLSHSSIDEVIDMKLKEKAERMSKVIDEDIPLLSRLHDDDETDLVQALIKHHDQRNP